MQQAVRRLVNLGVDPYLGSKDRYVLQLESSEFVGVGRPLRREDGSVIYRSYNQ
jgi:hypothetical protein